ncbi:MAG: hypothetical protein EAZ76_05430 [Nostocales cyanobacterium]|nr:MAG: hypothetical protein EAZ87_04105 [Nostocales cyanobacterium]TAF18120.1 MAG: hypothetical protein EAZ76_05430 [Nostocales cyanobacterium]
MVSRVLIVNSYQLSVISYQLSVQTSYCHLSPVNCQLSTVTCQVFVFQFVLHGRAICCIMLNII